ncbi:MAG: acylphosphatase [Firmicutes bacterium]|nr:acylphosphatase [Bacillota bacterium]MDH7495115.1 acylphosphatase [Bacillota bacterium]
MGSDKTRAEITVTGRVQGVGFREFARRHATSLGLLGWVRNRHDGSVALVIEGELCRVERLIALLREGPPWARVDDVDVRWSAYRGEFVSFTVRG